LISGGLMMLGEQVGLQDRLFYEFNLEDRVPADHFLRKIDAVLDLSWLRKPYLSLSFSTASVRRRHFAGLNCDKPCIRSQRPGGRGE
jgi:hypothetical protein